MTRIPEGLAVSISIRTGAGTALGIAMGNMLLWIPAGGAIGVTLWVVRNQAKLFVDTSVLTRSSPIPGSPDTLGKRKWHLRNRSCVVAQRSPQLRTICQRFWPVGGISRDDPMLQCGRRVPLQSAESIKEP